MKLIPLFLLVALGAVASGARYVSSHALLAPRLIPGSEFMKSPEFTTAQAIPVDAKSRRILARAREAENASVELERRGDRKGAIAKLRVALSLAESVQTGSG